VQQMPKK